MKISGAAAARARKAVRFIEQGRHENNRAFDNCFEMYDGDQIMWHLLKIYSTSSCFRSACLHHNLISWLWRAVNALEFPARDDDPHTTFHFEPGRENEAKPGDSILTRKVNDHLTMIWLKDAEDRDLYQLRCDGHEVNWLSSRRSQDIYLREMNEVMMAQNERARGLDIWPCHVRL